MDTTTSGFAVERCYWDSAAGGGEGGKKEKTLRTDTNRHTPHRETLRIIRRNARRVRGAVQDEILNGEMLGVG